MQSEETYNAANVDHVKQADREAKSERERELDDIAHVLSTKQGRRFFSRYMKICGIYKTSFTGNNSTFFAEGERNVGIKLLADMNEAAPELYIKMLQDELELKKQKEKTKK